MTCGLDSTVNMGISTNVEDQLMILNVLSNSLYTNKVAAVLREYGCNAFDANVEANRGHQPIEVRLPNRLEATVAIRDFGFGMTEEQILTVFCRLGRSTKRDSNEFTGMLGIGSKAGFAYGDSFTVTSYTGGIKCVYNCFRDRGAPKLAKMLETKTDAPDGVEVKVPVRQQDINEFVSTAERVFRYFKVRPIIHGAKIEFNDLAKQYEGTGWRFTGGGKSYAIMGNVGYDLNPDSMGYNVGEHVKGLLRCGVELDFQIGDLEIAANREGLQYRDITKNSIKARIDVMKAEVGTIFQDKIAKAPTLWEATQMYADIFEKRGEHTLQDLRRLVGGSITWKGKALKSGRFHVGDGQVQPGIVSIYTYTKNGWNSRLSKAGPLADHVYANEKVMFIENDLPGQKGSSARLKGFFETNKTHETACIVSPVDAKGFAAWWKKWQLDGAPIVKYSTIPPSVSLTAAANGGVNAHKKKHSAKAFVLHEKAAHGYRSTRSLFWETEDVDPKKGSGVYVTVDKFFIIAPKGVIVNHVIVNHEQHPHEFISQYIAKMRKAGFLKGEKLYGFKANWLKAGRLGTGWVSLQDHLASELDTMKATLAQEMADYLHICDYTDFLTDEARKQVPATTSLRKLMDEVYRMRNPKADTKLLTYVHSQDGDPWVKAVTLPKPSVNLTELEDNVRADYPMLDVWADDRAGKKLSSLTKEHIKLALEYVNLVDSI